MNRRRFLISITGIVAASPLALRQPLATTLPLETVVAGLTMAQWQTIELVQEHLFPAERNHLHNTPGAKDIHAATYLQSVLNEPRHDPADRDFLRKGLIQLQSITKKESGQTFEQLSHSQRDAVLRKLEQAPDGRHWISMLLEYIMEALLTDPVYGGNPHGIGWQWLQHQAGFPRPPRISG
ncbi:MAG: gluconate 2-dehydrogenase subunit 3 family protein [Gammaproteobacteria bacterium]|nr:gluconate 2-dehydrogenase subunit 3 family protein [Gammaproteobacteria bacterium]